MIALAVGLALIFVIVEDLRRYRIRNGLVLLLGAGFLAACLWQGRTDLLAPHLLFGLFGLALLFLAFLAGLIGGGDAKLLSVALIWIGPEGAFVFSLALLLFVLLYVAGAKLGWLPSREKGGRTQIPFGPSIALAWAAVLLLSAYLGLSQL